MASRFFDLSNSMIYDLERSVDLRWLFDPMLHSSLDDLVTIFFIALKCISPDSKSFQGNSIKLIALQMGPIPPWIPKPAATSLNPISESTFHFHFFSPECQTSRRLRIPDYILSKEVPRVLCKAVKDGGNVLSTWHLHLSSILFPIFIVSAFPFWL